MKTVIVYYSQHHGNTKKVLDAIARKNEVTLINITDKNNADISAYDRIGFASGIYFGKFSKQILEFARKNMPSGKKVFFIGTCGSPGKKYFDCIRRITEEKNCKELGTYLCRGYDTFGPFKLMGGIAKNHPNQEELNGAVRFYKEL